MHIYDFISDDFHYQLKKNARQRPKRIAFEQVLENYILDIISYLENQKLDNTSESRLLHSKLKDNFEVKDFFSWLLAYMYGEKKNIINILNELLEIYKIFIRGKQHNAVLRMHDLLEKYEILDDLGGVSWGGYFKCRKLIENNIEDALVDEFFFHIPFYRRYLVANQRFSVSGIPMNYLGSSLATAIFEMGYNDLNKPDGLGISFWGFNPSVTYENIEDNRSSLRSKIFTISNGIFDMVNDRFMKILNDDEIDSKNNYIWLLAALTLENSQVDIRKFFICQVCTFIVDWFDHNGEVNNGKGINSFCEEYVIPQILTEAIRLHKYDGIIYPSTKFADHKIFSNAGWITGEIATNLVMFTKYYSKSDYDDALIKNFKIIVTKQEILNSKTLQEETKEILKWMAFYYKFIDEHCQNSKMIMQAEGILRNCAKRLMLYTDLQIDGNKYCESYVGCLEIYCILEYCRFLFGKVEARFYEAFEKFIEEVEKDKQQFPWFDSKKERFNAVSN
jgi:hypothetical protein